MPCVVLLVVGVLLYQIAKGIADRTANHAAMAAQVLCYSFIGGVLDSYNTLSQKQQTNLPPTLFVLADNDPISDGSLEYEGALQGRGVSTEVKPRAAMREIR